MHLPFTLHVHVYTVVYILYVFTSVLVSFFTCEILVQYKILFFYQARLSDVVESLITKIASQVITIINFTIITIIHLIITVCILYKIIINATGQVYNRIYML